MRTYRFSDWCDVLANLVYYNTEEIKLLSSYPREPPEALLHADVTEDSGVVPLSVYSFCKTNSRMFLIVHISNVSLSSVSF